MEGGNVKAGNILSHGKDENFLISWRGDWGSARVIVMLGPYKNRGPVTL